MSGSRALKFPSLVRWESPKSAMLHFVTLRHAGLTLEIRKVCRKAAVDAFYGVFPMISSPLRPFLTSAAVLVIMLASLSSAQAFHGRFVAGRGFGGQGYAAGRTINRTPGSTTATRGVETA